MYGIRNSRNASFDRREAARLSLIDNARISDTWRDEGEAYTVYFYDRPDGRPAMLAYRDKRLIPALYCCFRNRQARHDRAVRFVSNVKAYD